MNKNSTSFYEQAIYYYVKKYFDDAQNRVKYHCKNGEVAEIDIFIPSLGVGIEYDGKYWHKDKLLYDENKNQVLNDSGIFIIRVRDAGLPEMEKFTGITLIHGSPQGLHTDEIIETIIHELSPMCSDYNKKQKLLSFSLPHTAFIADAPDINSYRYLTPIKDNILANCGIQYWDYKKNGRLNPENIPRNKSFQFKVWVVCEKGYSFQSEVPLFYNHIDCAIKGYECKNCIRGICPFSSFCNYECDFITAYLEALLQGKCPFPENQREILVDILCKRKFTINAMKRVCYCTDRKLEENFNKLFVNTGANGVDYFLFGRNINVSEVEELLIAKDFVRKFGFPIYFSVVPFDNQTKIDDLLDYLQWYINIDPRFNGLLVKRIYYEDIYEGKVSKNMIKKFAELIENNPVAFKYEKSMIADIHNRVAQTT